MIYRLVIPETGTAQELRVLQWHKNEGDTVASDDLLLELETDKAIVEVRAPRPCVVRKVAVAQGEWAVAGPAIAWLSDTIDETFQAERAEDFAPVWEIV